MQETRSYDSNFGQTCAGRSFAAGQGAVDSMQACKGLVTYLRIDRLLASWNILGSAGTTPASVAQIYCERL
jgi:hypothetical protein